MLMALIWGVNFPVIKAALSEIDPLAFNALRFPLASLVVFMVLRRQGPIPKPAGSDWPRIITLGVLGNLVYQGFFIFGVSGTLAGNASILLATVPVWTMALSALRRHERPGTTVWGGVFATLVGMLLVVLGGSLNVSIHGATLLGDLLIIGAAVTWSTYTVGSRRMIEKYGSLNVTAWTLWIGTVGLVLAGAHSLLRTPIQAVTPWAWAGVAYSGALAIGVAYILWYRGVQRIGNARTAAYSNLTPIVALGVAWAWLGEALSLLQITGAGVVLGGLTLARLGRDRPLSPTEGP
jgi:drug/metabolite transporter (DMT)-like permease